MSVIFCSPFEGNASAVRGIITSVEAVRALSVKSPREGGQSRRIYSYLSATSESTSWSILSLSIAVDISSSIPAKSREAPARESPVLPTFSIGKPSLSLIAS